MAAAAVLSSYAAAAHPPALQRLAQQALAASNDAANVFCGPNNDKPNTVHVIPNDPAAISRALHANMAARVAELRSASRGTDAAELAAATDPATPIQPFTPADVPTPGPGEAPTHVSECRHFRLAAARLLWACICHEPTVALLPGSAPLPLREAAMQLLDYANSRQPTTHASLDAGAAFSICAKWVYADDRAAVLAALRAGSGTPVSDSERPTLARVVFQILLLDNQAARRHGFSSEPAERALGATTHVFPALDKLVACVNSDQ